MKNIITTLFLLLHLFLSGNIAVGAEDLLIRSSANPKDPWLGQKVIVIIDVLVANGWAQAKSFRDTEIEGGYLLRYETQGTRLNETIDGRSYSGQRYEFFFFARQSGKLIIPEIPLDIEVKSWGRAATPEVQRKSSPSITLSVKSPPTMTSPTTIVSTTEYRASQVWEPEADSLQPGDAVSRIITLEATDVSAMLFSPLSFTDIDGIGVYPGEATVHDNYARGELTGKRVEKVSYVMEQGGSYELPDIEFFWWDVDGEKLEKILLPGRSLTVSGEMANGSDSMEELEADAESDSLLPLGLVALLLMAGVFHYRTQLSDFFSRQLKAGRESERSYFRRVADAARSNDPRTVLRATMQWLDRLSLEPSPPRLDQFVEHYGNHELQQAAEHLMDPSMTETARQQMTVFYKGLAKARTKWLSEKQQRKKIDALLPEIGLSSQKKS